MRRRRSPAASNRRGLASSAPVCAAKFIVADNGSTDGSPAIAEKLGARVVTVKEKGYGSALRGGIQAASGRWILMGDADDSYDFSEADRFVKKFREGFELVMGCRLPVRRRHHSARRDAVEKPPARQSGAVVHRTAFLQMPGARFSLRTARIHQGGV